MKSHFCHTIFAVFLILLLGMKAHAQVSFTSDPNNPNLQSDFTVGAPGGTVTVSSGQIPIAPASSVFFQLTIYRPAGSSDNGYVTLYSDTTPPGTSGANPNLLISNTLTQNTGSTYNTYSKPSWGTSGNKDYFLITGSFNTSSIRSGDTKLYAVYFNTSRSPSASPTLEAVSPPLNIVPGSASGSGGGFVGPGVKPATYTYCINAGDPMPTLDATYDLGKLSFANDDSDRVLWQSSTDGGKNWSDVYEMNPVPQTQSYQPSPVDRTTYYRAHSDTRDCTYVLWGCHWKTLGATPWFVVNILGKTPIPIQPFATVCVSNITPVTVSVAASTTAISYDWTVPSGWTINGGGQSATTTIPNISVTPPTGTLTNDYPIYVTASGTCGSASSPATSYVRVGNYNTLPTPSGINFIAGSYSTSCLPTYDIICTPIVGATTYRATLSTGYSVNGVYNQGGYNVRFPFGYQVNQSGGINMSVTVTATGPCGTSSTNYGPRQLNGPACYRTASATEQETDQATYPNPATNQVMVKGVAQEAQVTFYDAQGTCRKFVTLPAKDGETPINLLDLPTGLYHLRISVKGKILRQMQLVVNH